MIRLLILAVALAGVTYGQSTLVVDIPFEFSMANKMMPAGEYTISLKADPAGIIVVHSTDRNNAAVVLTFGASDRSSPEGSGFVAFRRYQDRYFLATVWHPYMVNDREVPKSRMERELVSSRLLAGGPVTVTILARSAR